MKTHSLTIAPILGCLKAAEKFIGAPLDFTTYSQDQEEFVTRFVPVWDGLDKLQAELTSIADKDVNVVNRFLKDKGFDIQLPPPSDPKRTFNVASVLNVLVEWLKEGIVTQLTHRNTGKLYPAAKVKEGVTIYQAATGEMVVCIETKTHDKVWMMPIDEVPSGRFGIQDIIRNLPKLTELHSFEGVIFPMIDYDQQVDISWLEGMDVHQDWKIEKAIQQTKFKMNEKGARAKSGVAMTCLYKSAVPFKQPVIIDKPFVLWIGRKGVRFPVFAGVFTEDVWKKPANLD